MFTLCPKCGHSPLPIDQKLPAACPACGVILAKVEQAMSVRVGETVEVAIDSNRGVQSGELSGEDPRTLLSLLLHTTERIDSRTFWSRVVLLIAFAVWGVLLVAQDYRTGQLGSTFIHEPLLIFHEAGHVVFRLFGEWVMVLGGTLGQLTIPAILGSALLIRNRDPFGASLGLWLFGVSLLDVSAYMYDALHPQLMLLSGMTGEDGGHDWIYLFSSTGLLQESQLIGAIVHKVGALLVFLAIVWGGWVLRLQHARLNDPYGKDAN